MEVVSASTLISPRFAAWLRDAVLRDPATHTYLLYDLVYEPENTVAKIVLEGLEVLGYVLEWCRGSLCAIHVWGRVPRELVEEFLTTLSARRLYVHVHEPSLEEEVSRIVERAWGGGRCWSSRFVDMVVNRELFKPFSERVSAVVRLLDSRRDLDQFVEMKRVQGRAMTRSEAESWLSTRVYVGAFVNGVLASMAGAVARVRDAWIVADVFTRPEHRGKGFATAVTSELTRLGLDSGVKWLALHVEEGNRIAMRIYEKLGYRRVRSKLWIMCEK